MFAFILAIIFAIAGFVVSGVVTVIRNKQWKEVVEHNDRVGRETDESKAPKPFTLSRYIGLALAAVLIVLSCVTVVPTGYTGILTTFGRVDNRTVDAGLNFIMPWQKVVKLDNRIQLMEFTFQAFSSDTQEADVVGTVNFSVDPQTARNLYTTVGSDYFDKVVKSRLYEDTKVIISRYAAEQLITERDQPSMQVTELLIADMEQYGLNNIRVSLTDIDFTDQYTQAVEAKQVAAQNKLKAETEQAQKTMEEEQAAKRAIIQANADAEQAVIAANADLEVVKIQAEASLYAGEKEAEMNKRISESLTSGLVDYYWIKQWDGKLPTTVLGSDGSYMIDLH